MNRILPEDIPEAGQIAKGQVIEIYAETEEDRKELLQILEDKEWRWWPHYKPTIWRPNGPKPYYIYLNHDRFIRWSGHQVKNSTKQFVYLTKGWVNPQNTTELLHKHHCPLCNSLGDDLVFKFYCTNNTCNNYKE